MRWLLALLLVLAACQQIEPVPYEPPRPAPDDPIRPEIPREYVPDEEPPVDTEQPTGQDVLIYEDIVPRLTLEIPITETIGYNHPVITSREFPLLKHHAIPLPTGSYVRYTEELIFDFGHNNTGRVIFSKDELDDSIGTFLFFKEDEPIFEYQLVLEGGYTWFDLLGINIQILGHTYTIAEATETAVVLYGVDVENSLLFSDGKKLVVDDEKQQNTKAFVHPDSLIYRLFVQGEGDTGDNILLSPGESLVDNIGQDKFASKLLNLRYEGADLSEATRIRFDKVKHGYRLTFESPEGIVSIPLVEEDAGRIMLGRLDEPLHIEPCKRREYCIAPGDMVLLTTPPGGTYVLTYSDISVHPNRLIMRSPHNRYDYEYLGYPGDGATDIVVGDYAFHTDIGPIDNETGDANISILMPRDYNRDILVKGGFLIHIGDIVDNKTLPLQIVVPRVHTIDRHEEHTHVNITFDGEWKIAVEFLDTVQFENTEDTIGISRYGVTFVLDKEKRSGLKQNEAEELEILIPTKQTMARIRLEG